MIRQAKKMILMLVDAILIALANGIAFYFVDYYVTLSGLYLVATIIVEILLYLVVANGGRVFSKINRYTRYQH